MIVDKAKFTELYDEIKAENTHELKDEPKFMRASRVEKLLDIKPSTRKRLVTSGRLKSVKTGESMQSAMRITKDSVLHLISMWQTQAEYEDSIK